jgi:hypothetical protein
MARGIAAGMLLWASACFAVSLGVGVFGGVAMPTTKMATWEIPDVSPGHPGYSPFTGSDMALSPKFGAKAIIGFGHGWEAEAAVAYHLGHGVKDWQENDFLEEPKSTLIPITVGANYRFNFGNLGLYAGAGGGYYLEKFKGGVWWNAAFREPEYFTTDVSLNGPGLYFGGGVTYAFGRFALDVSPRYNVIFNDGFFDMEGLGWTPSGNKFLIQARGIDKDYNDTYLDVLAGVNYYFM